MRGGDRASGPLDSRILGRGPKRDLEDYIRKRDFARWCVNGALMSEAKPDALFMHCLPAHRGEEVTADVLEGPQSVVWDEAENRLHAQKALLEYLVCGRVAAPGDAK